VQYTNQPSVNTQGEAVPAATVNGTNPDSLDWSSWSVYRVDWMPKQTSWYVNGASVANISFQTPKDPSQLIVNMWSDGGQWTGNMTNYDEAYLQIQWIEMVYNTSGAYTQSSKRAVDSHNAYGVLEKRKGSSQWCKTVCSIDNVTDVGTPKVLSNSSSAAASYGWPSSSVLGTALLPVLSTGLLAWGVL